MGKNIAKLVVKMKSKSLIDIETMGDGANQVFMAAAAVAHTVADNGKGNRKKAEAIMTVAKDIIDSVFEVAWKSEYASKQDLKDHIDDHNNPHHVTAEQVGLGNVPNVTPTNQQPVFSNDYITKTDGSYDVQNIASGEKLGNILRKIRTAIAAFIAHLSAKNPHKISAADISAAAMDHKHNADDVTSGTFPISRGGTGAQTATQALANLGAMPTSGGTFTGAVRFQQSTYFGTDNSYYVGSDGTANFRKVYGAVYNDYAEWFPRGCDTKPGDIIALDVGSQTERYIKAVGKMDRVVGVHTDEYAYLIGGDILKSFLMIFPEWLAAILVAVGAVAAALGLVRLGYGLFVAKTVYKWIVNAEEKFGSGMGAEKKAHVIAVLRGYTPDWLDWAINEKTLDWIVQMVFNVTKNKLEDYMEKKSAETTQTVAHFGNVGEGKNGRKE